jgi:hypothetical protein
MKIEHLEIDKVEVEQWYIVNIKNISGGVTTYRRKVENNSTKPEVIWECQRGLNWVPMYNPEEMEEALTEWVIRNDKPIV